MSFFTKMKHGSLKIWLALKYGKILPVNLQKILLMYHQEREKDRFYLILDQQKLDFYLGACYFTGVQNPISLRTTILK